MGEDAGELGSFLVAKDSFFVAAWEEGWEYKILLLKLIHFLKQCINHINKRARHSMKGNTIKFSHFLTTTTLFGGAT